MDKGVLEVPTTPICDVTESDAVVVHSTSVEPEEEKKEYRLEGVRPSRQKTPQRSFSKAYWKMSKGLMAQATAKKSTYVKSQASLCAECVQTEKQSKRSLQAKTPHTQSLHSRRLEESREDTEDPLVRHEPRGRDGTYHLSAISSKGEAEDTKSVSNGKEPAPDQHLTLMSGGSGSSHKSIKASYRKAKKTCSKLSAKESFASLGPDVKAEGKFLLENRNSLTSANSKCKFVHADHLASSDEQRRALCEAALIMGQKRLSDRSKLLKTSLTSTSFTDFNQLGFNLRSNIFQVRINWQTQVHSPGDKEALQHLATYLIKGGPLKTQSLMKDSYTPDVIQKAIRDPKSWHGRTIDDLGKWHQKNALNINLQKALENKYGKKKGKQ